MGDSVEVDAIPSSTLRGLIRSAIERWIDPHELRMTRIAEASERQILARIADDWEDEPLGDGWVQSSAPEQEFLAHLTALDGVTVWVGEPGPGKPEFLRPNGWQQLDPSGNVTRLKAFRLAGAVGDEHRAAARGCRCGPGQRR